MRYEETRELDQEKFPRLTEVKQATFNRMVEIGRKKIEEKKAKSGRKASSV